MPIEAVAVVQQTCDKRSDYTTETSKLLLANVGILSIPMLLLSTSATPAQQMDFTSKYYQELKRCTSSLCCFTSKAQSCFILLGLPT